ncbi:MAG: hypothetical protein SFT90_06680 [Rickettsiales bacterium]|nr:hypothetical protein [Rickettsiales bacterium]
MTKKTLYIHIGTCKTGTTSLQSFLYKNADLLKSKGLFYPKIEFSDAYKESHYFSEYTNFRPLFLNFDDRKSRINQTMWIDKYYPQIINSNCDKILLSEEVLSYQEDLAIFDDPAFSVFDVKIIVYVRKYVEYMCSMWSETVKPILRHPKGRMSLQEFLQDDIFPYGLLMDYINKFGADNVILRPFEKEQWHNKNLYSDFLNIFDIENSDDFIRVPNENEGFNRNICELFRIINELKLNYNDSHKASKLFYSQKFLAQPKAIDTLTDEDIKDFTDKNLEKENLLANQFGKESLFINPYPSIYGKKRESYKSATFSIEELEILKEIIKLKNNTIFSSSEEINKIFNSINN